ncbi:hypothetical protein LCGC14_0363980 [marine sediment metagenome]|uniref:Uncharacterized protein n=1 Tax=marine sediment metagenome TaxID=412755 RepID=A0A0F9TCV9_9ZZZZ
MASHKSPSSKRWLDQRDTREILATRRAKAKYKAEGLSCKTFDEPSGHGYESAGHYHWRSDHKNLAKPVLRTRRVKVVEPAVWSNG